MLQLIARISSRVFLGEELCRDEAWLRITREYTITAFRAAEELRVYPVLVRYIVHWFMPSCQKARALVKEARRVIGPVIEQRRRARKEAEANGLEYKAPEDAIEWFEAEAHGAAYDPPNAQLIMSIAAIHTTTDLTCQTLTCIAQHPEIIGELREEIRSALAEGGWQKTTLYNMKLLDSVIKESQRLKPIGLGNFVPRYPIWNYANKLNQSCHAPHRP